VTMNSKGLDWAWTRASGGTPTIEGEQGEK
jgi:hypothetical protein